MNLSKITSVLLILAFVVSFSISDSFAQAPTLSASTDKSSYAVGDTIIISGNFESEGKHNLHFVIYFDGDTEDVLYNSLIQPNNDGYFEYKISSDAISSWTQYGEYTVLVENFGDYVSFETNFDFSALPDNADEPIETVPVEIAPVTAPTPTTTTESNNDAKDDTNSMRIKVRTLQNTIDTLKAENTKLLSNNVALLKSANTNSDSNVNTLQEKINTLETEKAKLLSNNVALLKSANNNSANSDAASQSRINNLESENAQLNTKLSALSNQTTDVAISENIILKQENNQLKIDNQNLADTIDSLSAKIIHLRGVILEQARIIMEQAQKYGLPIR